MFRVNISSGIIDARGVVQESYPDMDGFSSDDFVQAFSDLRGRDVTIVLNSQGGVVSEGLSIFNQIEAHDGVVTVVIDAVAASIASVIAMAADRIVMRRKAQIFVHDPWTIAMGNASGFRTVADHLDMLGREIAEVYSERATLNGKNGAIDYWLALMKEETWFTAEQALESGLAEEISTREMRESIDDSDESENREQQQEEESKILEPVARLTSTRILAEVLDKRHRVMRERLGIR